MTALPRSFLSRPIAHRALHDRAAGRVENSLASVRAAVEAGYGIEIDVQCSRDGQAMVFHDYVLDRLTGETGAVGARTAEDLARIALTDDGGGIPTLPEVLEAIGGRVPLLIEIKDQDGAMGPATGPLGAAVARALEGYDGDVALMSFNPHHVAEMARLCPEQPRGLTTDPFAEDDWPTIPAARRAELAAIPDYGPVGACFVSHKAADLSSARVAELKGDGASVLCWTIRSAEAERAARKVADNITFEGYPA